MAAWENLRLRPFDAQQGIQLGALVWLVDERGDGQCLLLGPDGAGAKLCLEGQQVRVISPRSPLGQRLIGCEPGERIELRIGDTRQLFQVQRAT